MEDPVPLGPNLLLGSRQDPPRLVFGLLGQVLAKGFGSLPRLLHDAIGVGARPGELLPVVGEQLVRIGPRLLGLLQVALDLAPARLERLVQPRQDPLRHEEEEDAEGDRPDDELGDLRIEVLLVAHLLGGQDGRCDEPVHLDLPT